MITPNFEIKKVNKDPNGEDITSKIKLSRKDLFYSIIRKNVNLVDIYMYKNESQNYSNMLSIIGEETEEELGNYLVSSPYELTNSYILSLLTSKGIITDYRIYRSSDLVDIAFGKSNIKSVNNIKCKTLIIIVDNTGSEYYQQLIIQIMENRMMLGLFTITIVNIHSSLFSDKISMLDDYFFEDINIKERFGYIDLFEVKERRKNKKGIWK
ncbi:MAG: hypothetical protein ACRC0R_05260 [Cetobacterium sp.]